MRFPRKMLSILITCCLFFILFSKVNWQQMIAAAQSTNLLFFFAAILTSLFINVVIETDRLRFILKIFNCPISFSEVFQINMGSLPLSVFPTGKMHLMSQVIYLRKHKEFSLVKGTYIVWLSLLYSFYAFLILLITAVAFCLVSNNNVILSQSIIPLFIVGVFGVFLLLFGIGIRNKNIKNAIIGWLDKFHYSWIDKLKELIHVYGKLTYQQLWLFLLYSMILKYFSLLVYYFLAKSLMLNIPIISILIYVPLVMIFANIPITFAGLGLRESLVLAFFSSYGSIESIIFLGMLFSLSENIIPAFLGLIFTKKYLSKLLISRTQ